MESPAAGGKSKPPWDNPHYFTDAGLRDAQEYFFQTHAKNSRLIAEGRSAQGVLKSNVRRKLNKEMGEDFKMYTGGSIGADQKAEDSKGIRGELNELLETVYIRIAPGKPIESPIQEDVTIISHPLGAMEVVFNMSCFYTTLQGRYASLASDRRKVLKSVLDEELFKWVWRMFYALALAEPDQKPDFDSKISSSGSSRVPLEKQQFNSFQKLVEIGTFLLGTSLAQSHLRFPLCYYYVSFLRQIQYRLLPTSDRKQLDAIYSAMRTRKADDPFEDVLTAIDFLMNTKGNSMHSFDDVLGDDESAASKFMPVGEIEFISGIQEFSDARFADSMKKYVPKVSKTELLEGEGVSMMPLLFLTRTLPFPVTQKILEGLPGPFLSLVRNRLAFGGDDDVTKVILDRVDEMVGERQKKGESYTITSVGKGGTTRTLSEDLSPAAGGKPKAAADQPADAAPAAKRVEPRKSTAADRPPDAEPAQAASAEEAQKPAAAAEAPGQAGGIAQILRERLIVSWWADKGSLKVVTVAPSEILELVGTDVRFIVPWILFAVRSGQVIRIPPDKLSRELMERILKSMLKGSTVARDARLSTEQRQELFQGNKGKPPHRVLLELVEKHQIGSMDPAQAGTFSRAIGNLMQKLGGSFTDFINNPMLEQHRDVARQLSEEEKMAVGVLNKVARA